MKVITDADNTAHRTGFTKAAAFGGFPNMNGFRAAAGFGSLAPRPASAARGGRLLDGCGARRLRGRHAGFTMLEVLIVVAILGLLLAITVPLVAAQANRARLEGTARGVYSVVLAARIQALKRASNVVVFFDTANRQIITFADNNLNGVQDPGEPTIGIFNLPARVEFQRPTGIVGDPSSVAFDGYPSGAGVIDDRIIFRVDASITQPPAPNSARPTALPSPPNVSGSFDCTGRRGVYIADNRGANFFRISVDDIGSAGKISLLKSTGPASLIFAPRPWTWQ